MLKSILSRFWPTWRIEPVLMSVEGRKRLYRVIQNLRTSEFLEWDDIYREAFGKSFDRGIDFESNFRSGRISRKRAAMLYRWLVKFYQRAAIDYEYDAHTQTYASAAFREADLIKFLRAEDGRRDESRASVEDQPPSGPPRS